VPTIQAELEKAIGKITGERVRINVASRTDAGVHAQGQVAAFVTAAVLSPLTFVRALNFHLPRDIAIKDARQVGEEFNPRKDALSREYRYTILNRPTPSPLQDRQAYFLSKQMDVEAMNRACQFLIGEHDFASFTDIREGTKSTVRRVIKAAIHKEREFMFFDMVAHAFLPHQVRRTVGSLIKVGSGKMGIEEFGEMISSGKLGMANLAAPPHGLCLIKVNYSDFGFTSYENLQY